MSGDDTRRATGDGEADTRRAYTLVFVVPGKGVVEATLDRPRMVLGREAPADIVLAHDTVSRTHAIVAAGRPPTIEDAGSANGTKVMGHRLERGTKTELPFGSVVQVGDVTGFVQATRAMAPGRVADESGSANIGRTGKRDAEIVVVDPKMQELYELLDVVAPSALSLLVLGETGVGKDVYAERVHRRSARARGPFVRINCAALPENLLEAELFGFERGAFTGAVAAKPGLFEAASGGTVFLDEIAELTLTTQSKLLRVLESDEVQRLGSVQTKKVDVRVVAATNKDLEQMVADDGFRADLYFRLAGITVTLPPLRERPSDILSLADRFVGRASAFTERAKEKLLTYDFPGNVRELKNIVTRAHVLARGGPIDADQLQLSTKLSRRAVEVRDDAKRALASRGDIGEIRGSFADLERERILEAMKAHGGNQSRAAEQLGIARSTLIRRLEQYGVLRPRKG